MGRRTRKRAAGSQSTRAQRDAARSSGATTGARRRATDQRPAPLWAPFPLTELVVLAGLALMGWGFIADGEDARRRIGAGLAVASLAGLELAVREHVTGFRSHTTLLAGAVAVAAIVALGLGAGVATLGVLLAVGASAFAAAWAGLRLLFRRRSGGLSFR